MRRQHALAAAAGVAAGAALVWAAGGFGEIRARAAAAAVPPPGSGWHDPAYAANPHLCPRAQIAGPLAGRHPLYRRPAAPGISGSVLAAGGWDWYLDPPSEAL